MLLGYLFGLLRIIEVFLMVQPASTDRKTEAKQSKANKTKAKHAEFRRAS